ncbi:MAG TPA: hypothetical protein DCX03_06450 [Bacteroidales bacterium]|nr:hypothetical protein [Bacteroidales bacterium]
MAVRRVVLIIPHTSFRKHLRVREFQLGKALASKYSVYYLGWLPHNPGFLSKVATQTRNLFRRISVEQVEGVNVIYVPKAQIKSEISLRLNEWFLRSLCRELRVEVIINASTFHCPINKEELNVRYLIDVVDDHFDASQREKNYVIREMMKADCIITITESLQRKIALLVNKGCVVIPNGVWLKQIRNLEQTTAERIREKFNINEGFIITYIGNHHKMWGNLQFTLQAFSVFAKQTPASQLVVVGPGDEISKLKRQHRGANVIFTGPVDASEIDGFFQLSDIGVVPFKLMPYTHNSLPIKALEYCAARKIVVASKLQSLLALRFPNTIFSELDVREWAKKMEEAKEYKWNSAWDQLIEKYDWQLLGERLGREIENLF